MENYYSLSDIKSIMGDEGMGGGWFLIVILFLFLFGFGGMGVNRNCGPGNCGNDGYVTTSQFESENNFRTLDNSNRMTQNGLCQLGYEQANLINSSTAQIVGNITGEGRNLQMQLADCCCTTQRAIDSLKLENCQNTQKILDVIQGNRIAEMQNQINQLQTQNMLCGVVRYPMASTWNAGSNPFCGCGCNGLSA